MPQALWLPMTNYEPTQRAAFDPKPHMDTLPASLGELMTGETRPADFGHTKDGDEVFIRPLTARPVISRPVDIDADSIQLDQLDARLMEPWHLPHQGHRPNDAEWDREAESAQVAGARMGGGDQQPSEPMPLAWTGARVGNLIGTIAGFAIVAALAVGAWALLLSGVLR